MALTIHKWIDTNDPDHATYYQTLSVFPGDQITIDVVDVAAWCAANWTPTGENVIIVRSQQASMHVLFRGTAPITTTQTIGEHVINNFVNEELNREYIEDLYQAIYDAGYTVKFVFMDWELVDCKRNQVYDGNGDWTDQDEGVIVYGYDVCGYLYDNYANILPPMHDPTMLSDPSNVWGDDAREMAMNGFDRWANRRWNYRVNGVYTPKAQELWPDCKVTQYDYYDTEGFMLLRPPGYSGGLAQLPKRSFSMNGVGAPALYISDQLYANYRDLMAFLDRVSFPCIPWIQAEWRIGHVDWPNYRITLQETIDLRVELEARGFTDAIQW